MSALSRRRFVVGSAAAAAMPFAGCGRAGESFGSRERDGRVRAAFWYSYGGKNREVLESMIARFHREQDEVFVDATFQGDYYEGLAKLRTSIAAGAAPTFSHVVGEVVPYLAEAGVLETLDEYPGANALDLVPELAQIGSFRPLRGGGRIGTPLVAVPFNRSTPILYANLRLLEREGIASIATWSDLESAASRLTQRHRDEVVRWGFESPVAWWFWVALVGAAGGDIVDEAGAITFGGEPGEKAIEFWQKLVHEDRTMKPPVGRDYDAWQAVMQDFLSERAAIICSSTAFMRYVEDNARFPVRALALPALVRRAVPTGGTFFVMLRGAPAETKRAAFRFIRWMAAPAQSREWSTRTGYLPVAAGAVRDLAASGYLDTHPNDKAALEQLAFVEPWPWSSDLFRAEREIIDPLLEEVILERTDARTTLARARSEAARL